MKLVNLRFQLQSEQINIIIHCNMYKQSQLIGGQVIELLEEGVWNKIAEKNIQRMVPVNVQKMNVYTFQSLVQLNSGELQLKDNVNPITDKKSLGRDNLLHNYIAIQKQINSVKNISKISEARTNLQKTQLGIKKNGLLNNNSILSNTKQALSSVKSKDQGSNNKFIQLNTLQSQFNMPKDKKSITISHLNDDISKDIEGLRNRIISIQQARIKQENQIKISQQKNIQRQQAMLKKKKQMQRFTYDYDGQFFSSKNPNPENTLGSAARVRSECNKDVIKAQGSKADKLKPPLTKLINQKLEERYRRIKSQNQQTQSYSDFYKETLAARFSNSLVNDQNVSEGVSIRETTSNFFKQKPLNRIGNKLTLTQFKKQIKSKRFKQFRVKPAETTNRYKSKKIVSYKSEQNFNENRKTLQVDLSQKKSEPAENNKRYKTLFESEDSFMLSNSKLSGAGNRFRSKGLVKISNPSLFSSVFDQSEAN